jgi:hypothetical protein
MSYDGRVLDDYSKEIMNENILLIEEFIDVTELIELL